MSKKAAVESSQVLDEGAPEENAQLETPPAEQPPEAPVEVVLVRVLVSCRLGKPNDVVEIPKEALRGLKELGCVDDHPDAIEYARGVIGGDGSDLVIE